MNKLLSLFSMFLIFSIQTSRAVDLTCSKDGTTILYVNGVDNSQKDAADSRDAVEKLKLNSSLDKKPDVLYRYCYNDSHGKKLDFIEATAQKLRELTGISRDASYAAVTSYLNGGIALIPPLLKALLTFANLDPDYVNYQQLVNYETQDTNELKNKIKQIMITDKRKLVIISHSQGNLFTNFAHDELMQENPDYVDLQKVLGNFQVASPASSVHIQKNDHLTNNQDFILNTPFSLSWNALLGSPLDTPPADPRPESDQEVCHSFIDTYLSNKHPQLQVVRSAFVSRLTSLAKELESNCSLPPTADFSFQSRAHAPTNADPMTYDFDGSISTDEDVQDPSNPNPLPEPPDFDIASFEWLIDGTTTLTGMNPTFTFTSEGSHSVQLIVTDLEGNKSEPKILSINVANEAPVVSFVSEIIGMRVKLNALASTDDGRIVDYAWSFSDGFVANGVLAEHIFLLPGTYTVTLTVTDNNGKSSSMMQNVTTFNQPPVADFTFTKQGLVVNFNASSSNDPDGQIVAYIWSFGDSANGSGSSPSHTYPTLGTYDVTLTVVDNFGSANSITKIVEVTDQAFGCLAFGPAQPGKFVINTVNGGTGAGMFVADTATVTPNILLNGGEICGNSSITAMGQFNPSFLTNSSFNNVQMTSGNYIQIINSTINLASIFSGSIGINGSFINASLSAASFIDITSSTVNAPVTATNFIGMQNSTINEPISGDNVIVINGVRF